MRGRINMKYGEGILKGFIIHQYWQKEKKQIFKGRQYQEIKPLQSQEEPQQQHRTVNCNPFHLCSLPFFPTFLLTRILIVQLLLIIPQIIPQSIPIQFTIRPPRGFLLQVYMTDPNNQSAEHIHVHLDMPPILDVPLELQENIHTQQVLEVQEEKVEVKKKQEECQVCSVWVPLQQTRIFSQCAHSCCLTCLNRHIQNQIANYRIAKCLAESCPQSLDSHSEHIRALPESLQKRYYKILVFENLSKDGNTKLCPSQNCEGFITLDSNPVSCGICNVVFCKECLLKAHKGSCDKNGAIYAQDNFKFRQCRKCKMVLQKTQGCNHMTCKCGHQFCYLCGEKWDSDHRCPIQMNTKRFFQCLLILSIMMLFICLDLVWAVAMLIALPIGVTLLIFFMSLAKGMKDMLDERTCIQMIIGSIFIYLVYFGMAFGRYMCQFFSNDIWRCWRKPRLLPLTHCIWYCMTKCFRLYEPLH